jgi:hypothetical protein
MNEALIFVGDADTRQRHIGVALWHPAGRAAASHRLVMSYGRGTAFAAAKSMNAIRKPSTM